MPYYRFLYGDCVGPNVDDAATYLEVTADELVDDQCTTAIEIAYTSSPACGGPPRFAATFDHRVFPIGDVALQPLFAQNTNTDYPCIAAPAVPGKQAHVLGDAIDLGTFTVTALR